MRDIASPAVKDITTFQVRGHTVILDHDLASFYGVPTKILNGSVKRIINRFPDDFMFQLSSEETQTLKADHGKTTEWVRILRRSPYAFTEEGIHAISYFLKSPRAVKISVELIKSFHMLRDTADNQKSMSEMIEQMQKRQDLESKRLWGLLRSVRQLEDFREEVSRRFETSNNGWLSEQSRRKIDRMRHELDQIERRAVAHRELFYLIVLIFGALFTALVFFPH